MENLDQKEIISKTTLKKESKDIKKFGEKLVKYNQEVLSKFNFPAGIYEAIMSLKILNPIQLRNGRFNI